MEELSEAIQSVLSKYPSVEVKGTKIVSQDYRDILHTIPHIREKYDEDFVICFSGAVGNKDGLKLDPISEDQFLDSLRNRRLLDAIFYDNSHYYEDYWREDGRIFLRGDFDERIREISIYGLQLYNIDVVADQEVREYVMFSDSKDKFIESRCMQILREISCPRCDSHTIYFEDDVPLTCNDCSLKVDISEFDFVYTDPISDIQIAFDWDVEIDDPEEGEETDE